MEYLIFRPLAALLLSLGACKPKESAEPTSTPTVSEPITESEEDILLPPAKVLG